MTEFLILYDNNQFKMKFSLDTTILELKTVILQRFNLVDLSKFNIFLEKAGFIDINPTLLNSPLSSLKTYFSYSNPPYYIFCFDKSKPENIIQNNNICSCKLIPNSNNSQPNDLPQIGIKLKQKSNILVCLSCAKNCFSIPVDYLQPDDYITDKSFTCQCQSDKNICKFTNFNLDHIGQSGDF